MIKVTGRAITTLVFSTFCPLIAGAQQANLDLQDRCATRAQKVFNIREFQDRSLASFTNHYNMKLGRCLIEIVQEAVPMGRELSTYREVSDAFEGKTFARYAWTSKKGMKYWDVPPSFCSVHLPSGETKSCSSSDEFDLLIKELME